MQAGKRRRYRVYGAPEIKATEMMSRPLRRLALLNGRFYTQDPSNPVATAVGIVGDRIAVVGSNDVAILSAGPNAELIDLGGRAALPGFIDSHVHFLGYSHDRERVRLDRAASIP